MEEGAIVTAYTEAPLCDEARRELEATSGSAGEVRVRAVCLAPAQTGGRLDLAAVGSGARRATEDSAAVAYLAERDPAALRFSRPILEEAGIAVVADDSGSRAMARLVEAIDAADSSEGLRESVQGSLNG